MSDFKCYIKDLQAKYLVIERNMLQIQGILLQYLKFNSITRGGGHFPCVFGQPWLVGYLEALATVGDCVILYIIGW